MEKNQLVEIFRTYLKREPKQEDFDFHLSKNYESFVTEVLNCPEYAQVKWGESGDRKPKIAILLSGHIRSNHYIKSLHHLQNYDYDVFIHTWDNFGFKGKETNLNDTTDLHRIQKIVSEIPNVKVSKIENNKNFILSLEDKGITYFNFSSPENFIKSQLYSISESYKIFEDYYKSKQETYDLVVRTRFENQFTEVRIDAGLISLLQNNKVIFTPNVGCGHVHPDSNGTTCQVCERMFHQQGLRKVHSFAHSHVICDLFAYGSVESMKDYCTLYENYDFFNQSFEEFNKKMIAEKKLNHTIDKNVYLLDRGDEGHLDSLYYLNCSYPERLLQFQLKDYLLPSSRNIKVLFQR